MSTENQPTPLIPEESSSVPSVSPPAPQEQEKQKAYEQWRLSAKLTLKALREQQSEHCAATRSLQRKIDDLEQVLANGASGGTAWQDFSKPVAASIERLSAPPK